MPRDRQRQRFMRCAADLSCCRSSASPLSGDVARRESGTSITRTNITRMRATARIGLVQSHNGGRNEAQMTRLARRAGKIASLTGAKTSR